MSLLFVQFHFTIYRQYKNIFFAVNTIKNVSLIRNEVNLGKGAALKEPFGTALRKDWLMLMVELLLLMQMDNIWLRT